MRKNDITSRLSSGLEGSIHSLQIGRVVQVQDDEDEKYRILLKTPVIDENARGIWASAASLDAGSGHGAFLKPQIDDEVIVGFINDDPQKAFILGILHSSKKPAPIVTHDIIHEKGFTTRSKLHLSFNDITNTITIDTPAGNSITLDEKGKNIVIVDQSKNKITMQPSGISMESPKNIDIKAGAVLTISGGTSLSIGAPSVSVKADADVSISGATAKLAGQGPTEIKGLPIKIN